MALGAAAGVLFMALQASAPPRLQIDVTMPREATGTMHFADRVVIHLPGIEPLTIPGNAPICDDQVALGAARYLVLCWSSTEGTNQTLTVLLVERRANRLVQAGSLRFTSSRPDSMILIRQANNRARIGVFAPERPTQMAIDAGIVDPWAVDSGTQALDVKIARRAKTGRVAALTPGDRFYAPMMKPALPGRGVIWFDVGANGFSRGPN